MIDQIQNSLIQTKKPVTDHHGLPRKQGIYAFFLAKNIDLGLFGKPEQIKQAKLAVQL